ncbi:receptor-like protein EIX1 [Humulus lupulus]|uniref:receptor-like protein EIX1 n=1 Tax=Humulus lupulus TaxID=3486 RepID=UPI002B406224|nr:receptor-like protein EIX1 [Humulus lupulus]
MTIKIVVLLFVLATSDHVWRTSSSVVEGSGNSKGLCIEKEKQALLTIKRSLIDPKKLLSSWTSGGTDCCSWKGIRCDNLTHHIISLDLNFECFDSDGFLESCSLGSEISPSLVELRHLRHLDLSNNQFTKIPKFIGCLSRLENLSLAKNPITDTISFQLRNLTKLQFLDLDIDTAGTLIVNDLQWLSYLPSLKIFRLSHTNFDKATDWLHSLKKTPALSSLQLDSCLFPQVDISSHSHANSSNSLKDLDISSSTIHPTTIPWLLNMSTNIVNLTIKKSQIQGGFPTSLENMRSLARIDLSVNKFEGGISKSLGSLCNLKELNLGFNKLNTTLPDILQSLNGCARSSLEKLDLGYNKIRGSLPDFSMLPYLRWLDVSYNKLNGTLTESTIIGELHHLERLYMSSNSFTGLVSQVFFQNNSKLTVLELFDNSLTLNFTSTWIPPFQLDRLLLRSCKLGPHFTTWLKTQVNISEIDISNSGIQDAIPNWFCNQTFPLAFANLSSNQFHGAIPPSLSNVMSLYLSNNDKHVSLSSFLCDQAQGITAVLEFSNNMVFERSLPDCRWNLKNLVVLNLNNNNFTGVVPRSVGLLYDLNFLILRQNSFSGHLPSSTTKKLSFSHNKFCD